MATQPEAAQSPVDSVTDQADERPAKRPKLTGDSSSQEATGKSASDNEDSDDEESVDEELEKILKDKGGVEGVDWVRVKIDERWFRMPLPNYQPERISEATKTAIEISLRTPPRFLYRVSSWEGRKKTNGYDTLTLHVPAAHVNLDEKCHDTIYDIPNGVSEVKEMLGRRFLWQDRRKDETLSWTSSLLFALVHATGRLAKGQRHVVIHVIDTTKVTTMAGKPVEFYFGPDLLDGLDIRSWPHWDWYERKNLKQPWYTHEWITHHVAKSPRESSYEANIGDLLNRGLYDILPGLKTSEEDDLRSLYHRCVHTRGFYHHKDEESRPPSAITFQDVAEAKRLARCFVDKRVRSQDPYCTPPLHIVIDVLAIVARRPRQEYFMAWVKANYTQQDLQYIAYDRSTRVANNLPEQAQALALARDAHFAMGLPSIPETDVWIADNDFSRECKWMKDAPRSIMIRERKAHTSLGLEKLLGDDVREKRKGKARAVIEGGKKEGVGDGENAYESAQPEGGNESLVEQRASGVARETGEDETQGSEGVVSGFDWSLNEDEDNVQMEMAVAASLEPGLLGAARGAMGSPLREHEAERQPVAVETEAQGPQMLAEDDF